VKVGPFSRRGVSRGAEATKAVDHDMGHDALLVPFGILEIARSQTQINQLWLTFGTSRETSDFIADALDRWWQQRGSCYMGVTRLQIELDNGPEINSSRTQFMKRLVDFADRTGLELELVYLPPYHSKYNVIERCWGVLENHWNGALLSSLEAVLNWAGTMKWRGVCPIVNLVDRVYQTGVRLTKAAFRPIAERLNRSSDIPKWSLTINPLSG
jgi:hypothetical protein